MLQQLALLKGFDLDGLDRTDPEFIHIWVECAKLAYADREAFYGDPKFVDVPMETLLSESLQRRAAQARRRAGVDGAASGPIEGYGGRVIVKGARAARPAPGEPTFARLHTGHGAGEAEVTPLGRGARRHGAHRRHRQGRQHVHGHAVGRLAAVLAGDPGARLAARHARADVLAGGGPARLAGARQAAALDAVGRHGAARRQALHDAGARPAATSRTSGTASSSCATPAAPAPSRA